MPGGRDRGDRGRGRDHGSALILTIVSIVMMVLIGTAYMQVARVDRRATRQVTTVDNLEAVQDAIIAKIAKTLKEDLIGSSGVIFDRAEQIEHYDYPHTNNAVQFEVLSGNPGGTVGSRLGDARGGQWDDMWLAAHAPTDNSSGVAVWSHITNMNGAFLELPDAGSGNAYPREQLVTNNGFANADGWAANGGDSFVRVEQGGTSLDSNPAGYQDYGVDADGDGLYDSRWTWAPEEVRQIGSLTYVVAYRIIDTSAMANLNVMTSVSAGMSSQNTVAPTNSMGYYPSDMGLRRLFGKWYNFQAPTELGNLQAARGLARTIPLPHGTYTFPNGQSLANYDGQGRAGAWLGTLSTEGARVYAGHYYGLSDEWELRGRGGLNTSTNATVEEDMPNITRKNFNEDTRVMQQVVGFGFPPAATEQQIYDWTAGGRAFPEGTNTAYQDSTRNFRFLRNMLTVYSGAAVFAPNWDGRMVAASDDRTSDVIQYDLNTHHNEETFPDGNARMQEIQDRLTKIFQIGSPTYLNMSTEQAADFAAEYALAIQDYADTDYTPSVKQQSGVTYYGLEILPFMREGYVQAAYEAKDTDGDPNNGYDEWQLVPNSVGIALSVGNPFDKPAKFSGGTVGASIRVRVMKGNTQVTTFAVPSNTAQLDARDNTKNDIAVFYSQANGAVAEDNGKGTNLVADLTLTSSFPNAARRINMGNGRANTAAATSSAGDNSELMFELQVEVQNNVFVTYDRLRVVGGGGDKVQVADKLTGGLPQQIQANPVRRHLQWSVKRDGQYGRYMSNHGVSISKQTPSSGGAFSTNLDHLGDDSKSVSGDTTLDNFQFAIANRQIFNPVELAYVAAIGFHDASDEGDLPTRLKKLRDGTQELLSGRDRLAGGWHRLFLYMPGMPAINGIGEPPSGGGGIPNTSNPIDRVPHAAMVFDMFTTLSPRFDLADNDRQNGVDDESELMVPGRLNVNTAPGVLMAFTTPMPEQLSEIEPLFHRIVEYRDFPNQRQTIVGGTEYVRRTNNATDRGISSLGELLMIRGSGNQHNMMRWARDTSPTSDLSRRLYPHPDQPGSRVLVDKPFNAQERMERFHFLMNTLTVRSDTYLAYVVVRGYQSDDFRQAPVDSLQFMALFDRSGVIDETSKVQTFNIKN